MRRTREILENNLGNPAHIDSVIISHMHGDHINHQSLRVIEEYGLKLRVYEKCLNQLRGKHYQGHRFKSLDLDTFSDQCFTVGNLSIQPFEVPHNPNFPNCGFVVRCNEGKNWKTAVIATDFHKSADVLDHFIDADFIFVESNHDLGLLARYFNPNSRYHMSNPKTAELLYMAYVQSRKKPHTVMLGHLSRERNTESYALRETKLVFREKGVDLHSKLFAAPAFESSKLVEI